jgi:glycosyltransferase involved in cell wall biosynthesis
MISLVVPCFNEEQSLPAFLARIVPLMISIGEPFEIVFVDDGSTDRTAKYILSRIEDSSFIRLIRLSRNFGKEAALTAGLQYATGDAVIPIDCDLQDPPELITDMVRLWKEGNQVVLACRRSRNTDSMFKRTTAVSFYKLIERISHVKIPPNCGDFRLMDRQVVNAVLSFPERSRFMKGIFAAAGYETAILEYDRPARESGSSSFNVWKLWNFALDGITSFTTLPLRIWTYLGAIIALFAICYAGWIVFHTLYWGVETPGYASLLTIGLFLASAILIGMGIQGEYIARLITETKQRPIYIVASTHGNTSC